MHDFLNFLNHLTRHWRTFASFSSYVHFCTYFIVRIQLIYFYINTHNSIIYFIYFSQLSVYYNRSINFCIIKSNYFMKSTLDWTDGSITPLKTAAKSRMNNLVSSANSYLKGERWSQTAMMSITIKKISLLLLGGSFVLAFVYKNNILYLDKICT